ncbi:MAG: MerR family transcriptional regulator [Nitriliruptoraceae bacterium]
MPPTPSPNPDPAQAANALDRPDAALAAAVAEDREATLDLDALAAEAGTTRTLLDALARAGLLLPHHLEEDGTARYSAADVRAVQAGLTLLEAGLPLAELLDLGRRTDTAIRDVAEHAVEAFLRFVRDPVRGTAASEDEASDRLVTAYERMLPATEQLVAHHLRRRLVAEATERVARELEDGSGR